MTDMSRGFKALVACAATVWLASCSEEERVHATWAEVSREVEISLLGLEESIDWEREMALVSEEAFLEGAASEAGTDLATLDEATRLELDPELKVIRVIARDQDEDTATRYAEAVATALKLARLQSEMNLVTPGVAEDGTLESDRMTYEKAKKALEEEAAKDGVLYQKGE